MELPALEGERVRLRPPGAEDAEALLAILREPEVARWWTSYDLATVREELPGTWVIEVGGEPAGWLQVHEEAEPDYPSVAFDILITSRLRGSGYGREALRLAVRHFAGRGHHRFTIDPAVENAAAVRAYEAIGFRPVGIMRRYERAPDGTWRDGLLMDLLADELLD